MHDAKPTRRIRSSILALAASVALCAVPATLSAEEEGPGAVEKKIKEQMEKILKLMKENEDALLKLSTGKSADPKGVDIEPPVPPEGSPPPSSGGSGSSGSGASGGGAGGSKGDDIRRKLEELLEQQRGSSRIPGELEALVRMIPTKKGQGEGQGEPQDQSGKEPNEAEMRDNRQEEQDPKENGGQDPQDPKGPRDPNDPMSNRKPEPDAPENPQDPKSGSFWDTQLPAEIREAAAGGKLKMIPVQYRDLVRRYLLWLQKNAK